MPAERDAGTRPARLDAKKLVRALSGPILTALLAGAVELLRPTALHAPGPAASMLIAVAWSAYVGGLASGLASCAIAVGYTAWFHLGPGGAVDPEHLRRFVDVAAGAPVIAVMMGVLRRRAQRSRAVAADAAVARQYSVLFEEAAEPMLLSDATQRYVFVNRRACELSGYAREELLRMRVGELVSSRAQDERSLRLEESRRAGEVRHERELVRRDGTRLRVEVAARRLADGRSLAILRDVTEERESVARLQEALSLVRATLESTTDGLLVVDTTGRWAGYNRRFGAMWGMPPELLESGDDARALEFALAQLEAPDAFIRKVRDLYATPEASSFDEFRLKDGRVFERYSIPQRVGDRVVGRVWSFRDVTEVRRQSETLLVTEQRLLHTETMDAMGRLAGGVAHDFNNMLTAILGEADYLLMQETLDPRQRSAVDTIRSASLRSAQLTRQLLAFGRRQKTQPVPIALAELLRGLEPLAQRLVGPGVTTSFEVTDGPGPWVYADPGQLEQAILNLVINASDAMPEGGTLVLRVSREHVGTEACVSRGARRTGVHARVSVSDTGVGIAAEALPHVFEPFFTTKPLGKGTGLGLASVHGIAQTAHGFVEVDSEAGRGTTFHVLLPEHDPSAPSEPAPGAAARARGERPELLVVDDEPQVLRLAATVLAEAGYAVTEASDAEEALTLARARTSPFALLVTDVVMPGASGPELARLLAAEGRVQRVVYMSGFPARARAEAPAELAGGALLHKPFRPAALLERVREMIEG